MRDSRITPRELRRLAHVRGYDGVAGLARRIGRSRQTVYRALRNPERFGPTVELIRRHIRNA